MRAAVVVAIVASAAVAHADVQDDLRDGDRFFERGQWPRAAAAFDRAIAKSPGQVSASAYAKRAAIFLILRDRVGGFAFLERARQRYPDAPELLEQEALLRWESGQRAAAVKLAERVVAARPGAFSVHNLIGEYHGTRAPARTAAAYEAYLAARPAELEPSDVLPRIRLGFAYLALARTAIAATDEARAAAQFERAAAQFERVLRHHADRPNARVNADNGLCAAYTGLARFDRAVTICDRARSSGRAEPSVWFNLGTSYLARNQVARAREAATQYARLRPTEARGLVLVGDTHYAERDYAAALEHYTRAEALLRADQPHDTAQVAIRLGKTYRRLPRPNLELAVAKLDLGFTANPRSTEVGLELGGALLAAGQDERAREVAERLLATSPGSSDARASLLVISGKAHYNLRALSEARQRFEAARSVRTSDISIQRALVATLNELAIAEPDPTAAAALLDGARAIAPGAAMTLTNVAVLALERGDCEVARRELERLATVQGHDPVLRTRLHARTFLCGTPDVRRASEAYAVAEREAKKANAARTLAEIYVEWAPLAWDSDLPTALARLERAVAAAAREPDVRAVAERNLALALWRRGWRALREGRAAEALADFDRALRMPTALQGHEPVAFELARGLALLHGNRIVEAGRVFDALASRGATTKLSPAALAAYARTRSGSVAVRQRAAVELARLGAPRELLASASEAIAYEQWRNGQPAAAARSLAIADKHATGDTSRRVALDRAALVLDRSDLAALEALAGNPVEALVDLGIVYEQLGRHADAVEAWQKARARGASARELTRWIDTKKRVWGL